MKSARLKHQGGNERTNANVACEMTSNYTNTLSLVPHPLRTS